MHEKAKVERLIHLFNETFKTYNTRLVKGQGEPIYVPKNESVPYHRIEFAHGFFSSAMHEIAHWCIAGDARRQLEDYGYWYCPDGRNQQQQADFEKVEVKPQALEWAFCLASSHAFQVSTDNLNGYQPDREAFTEKVRDQLLNYITHGFPQRAQVFIDALQGVFATPALSRAAVMEKQAS